VKTAIAPQISNAPTSDRCDLPAVGLTRKKERPRFDSCNLATTPRTAVPALGHLSRPVIQNEYAGLWLNHRNHRLNHIRDHISSDAVRGRRNGRTYTPSRPCFVDLGAIYGGVFRAFGSGSGEVRALRTTSL
jgi:hypothetical protein